MLFFLCLRCLPLGDRRNFVECCLVARIAQAEKDVPHPTFKSHTQQGAGASDFLARETASHACNLWAEYLSLKGAEGKRHLRVVGDAPGFPGSGRGHEVQLAIRDRHSDRGANSLAVPAERGQKHRVGGTGLRKRVLHGIYCNALLHKSYAPFVFSSVCTGLTEALSLLPVPGQAFG